MLFGTGFYSYNLTQAAIISILFHYSEGANSFSFYLM